jgi:hypothetical protein
VRAESQHDTRFGSVRPRARLEFTRDFEDERTTTIAYADEFGTRYAVAPGGVRRNSLLLGIGSDFNFGGGLKLGLDYQVRRSSSSDLEQGIRLQLTQELGATGPSRWFGLSDMFKDPVRVDASYTWDDNVSRSREARDKLSDHIFGVNVAEGAHLPDLRRTRASSPASSGRARQFYELTGAAPASPAAGQAELQYRSSGDWDATTFGLLGRVQGDYYQIGEAAADTATTSRLPRAARSPTASRRSRHHRQRALREERRCGTTRTMAPKVNLDYALGGPMGLAVLHRRNTARATSSRADASRSRASTSPRSSRRTTRSARATSPTAPTRRRGSARSATTGRSARAMRSTSRTVACR